MKKWDPVKKILALTAVVTAAFSVFWASGALAATENVTTGETFGRVTLAENSSYVSEAYNGGVLHLTAADSGIACATVDAENRIVVTGVGVGSTTVSYWYRASSTSSWLSGVLPVTVSKGTETASAVPASQVGMVFPQSGVSFYVGSTFTMSGIKVNGAERTAGQLLWLSADDRIVTVDKDTGLLTGVSSGSTTVYAIDPATKCCSSFVATVT